MSIEIGTKIGSYVITAPIGEGGMGEVYSAKDTRLGRDVAIKSLPAEFAQDPERLSRFEREARLLASLSHPNIAGIYGLEEVDDARYLVLELVEGESLAERLSRGPLPPDEAIDVAKQIAAGIEAAHESGVIHRDLKPGNVMLTASGTVKVLDFGLAKSGTADRAGSNPSLTASPTVAYSGTQAGVILGTAAYMSPEQARGREVDKRTDIWSFGCVLYECLTGRQAFEGETVSDLIAHILQTEPDWSALPAGTPNAVRRLLRRCLEKDHRSRLRDIGEARIELEDGVEEGMPSSTSAATGQAAPSFGRARLAVFGAVLVIASVLVTIGVWRALHPAPQRTLVRFEVADAEHMRIDDESSNSAISPDGRMLVFNAGDAGRKQLWLRSLETLEARPLEGTKDGYQPFWSPDSRYIGFFSFGKLKRVPASGGAVEELCESGSARGGTWNRQDVIFFAGQSGSLFRVSALGGEPKQITSIDSTSGETAHRFPHFLPDGRHYLYTSMPPKNGKFNIYVGELGSSKRKLLLSAQSGVLYSKTGHLLYQRDGSLVAQAFDSSNLRVRGEPIVVRESMSPTGYAGGPGFSVSDNGTLAYTTLKLPKARLAWFDIKGREVAKVPIEPASYVDMVLSPDDRRVALVRKNPGARNDIWIGDLERGVVSRFSQEKVSVDKPRWSPDGTRIAYQIDDGAPQSFVVRAVDGGSEARVFLQSDPEYKGLDCWTPDGRSLVYGSQDPKTQFDLWVLPLDGDQKPWLYLKTPFMEGGGKVSDDGRWMAYAGNESGHWEGYVQPFPSPGVRYQVTKGGGFVTGWLAGSKQLVFRESSSPTAFQIADVVPGKEFRLGPARVFCVLPRDGIVTRPTSDGKRILSLVPAGEPAPNSITVVLNWAQGLGAE